MSGQFDGSDIPVDAEDAANQMNHRMMEPRKYYWNRHCNKFCLRKVERSSNILRKAPKQKCITSLEQTTPLPPSSILHQAEKLVPESTKAQPSDKVTEKCPRKRENYKCMFCGKVFEYMKILERHMVVHTKEKSFQCQKCKMSFGWKSQLISQMKTHSDSDMCCHQCPLSFVNIKHLNNHIKTVHVGKVGGFENDNSNFSLKRAPKHGNSQVRPKTISKIPHKCSKCFEVFPWASWLRRHVQSKHPSNNTRQDRSDQVNFDSSRETKTHPPFQFQNFDLTRNQNQNQFNSVKLKSSILEVQPVITKFFCSSCDKLFYFKSKLRKHMLTHTKPKRFTCLVCQRAFTHKQELNKHVERQHLINCDQCDLKFFIEKHLNEHMLSVHTISVDCIRPADFTDTDNDPLWQSSMPPPKQCDKSPELPKPVSTLARSPIPTPYKFRENILPSEASLKPDSWNHVGSMCFPCLRCELKFSAKELLEQHCSSTHCVVRILRCPKCDLSFTDKTLFQLHSMSHRSEDQAFVSVVPLEKAEVVNCPKALPVKPKEKKEYICPYCSKIFSNKQNLKLHRNGHKNINLFKFSGCQASFATPSRLETHSKNHQKKVLVSIQSPDPVKVQETPHEELIKRELCGQHLFRETVVHLISCYMKE